MSALLALAVSCTVVGACVGVMMMPVAGCAGRHARDDVAVPTLVMAGVGVEADARAGLAGMSGADLEQATAHVDSFFRAVKSKDTPSIIAATHEHWGGVGGVRVAALAGIQNQVTRGEIGPNGAASLRERVLRYEDVLDKLAGPSPVTGARTAAPRGP